MKLIHRAVAVYFLLRGAWIIYAGLVYDQMPPVDTVAMGVGFTFLLVARDVLRAEA